jgi:hypothetical protein
MSFGGLTLVDGIRQHHLSSLKFGLLLALQSIFGFAVIGWLRHRFRKQVQAKILSEGSRSQDAAIH